MSVNAADDLIEDLAGEELAPGTVLLNGQYRITGFIANGGFGITYLARDSLDREVVIKECFAQSLCRRHGTRVTSRFPGHQEEIDKIHAHFLKEARALSRLTHPNIVGVHQVFEDNDTAYMALDYIRGYDLQKVIEFPGARLQPNLIVGITRKLLDAIHYMHGQGVLHCDISPDNIFLSDAGEPILIDFGAARPLAATLRKPYSGLTVVKDGYSPHCLYYLGGNSGPWSDLYSLGATLSHAITGKVPLNSQSRLAAMAEHRPDLQPPLAGNVKGYPAGFLEAIDKAMAVSPAARFQTAAEWIDAINHPQGYEGSNVKFLKKALGKADPPKTPTPAATAAAQATSPSQKTTGQKRMALNISGLNEITGFIGGCVVDSETGFMLASEAGGKLDLEAASAANTEVVRAKLRAIELLGLDDYIDDILITLGKQFHLIRPLEKTPTVFIYVALDKKTANLGLARVQVKKVEQSISI